MVILTTFQIFADCSNFRLGIKRKSGEIVLRLYNIQPKETFNNQEQEHEYIQKAVVSLINDGSFLHGGLDEQVSLNNLRWDDSD